MKNDKTESIRVRVTHNTRMKIKYLARKQDCSEAQVIRQALRKFLPSSLPKNTTKCNVLED